jgi:isopenicillin N synthase-like dioxygenase
LFPLFALALNLPETFFDDKVGFPRFCLSLVLIQLHQTRNSAAMMKLLHYPPQTGSADDRIIGIGAHTE